MLPSELLQLDTMSAEPYTMAQFSACTVGAALAIAGARLYANSHLLLPAARSMLLSNAEATRNGALPPRRQKLLDKFCESMWKLIVYSALWVLGVYALHDKAWLWRTSAFWEGWPVQAYSARVLHYYCLQAGFYLSSIFMLALWETRRKDFPVMMAHHWVALSLIAASYTCGYVRVGSVILLLHDVSDILLEAAKLLNYAGKEGPSVTVFAIMAASWLYLRLVLFPRNILWSCAIEATGILGRPVDHYYAFNGLLLTLLAMHTYWFLQILRVAATAVRGAARDVREDDD